MKNSFICALILSGFVSCSNSTPGESSKVDSLGIVYEHYSNLVNFDTIKIDTFQRKDAVSAKTIREIDSLIKEVINSDSIANKVDRFLQINENDSIIKVPDFKERPDGMFFASYSILTKANRIVFISESPNSNAGDWYDIHQYYFYDNGITKAFTVDYSVFDGNVEGEIRREKLACYFDSTGKMIKKSYQIKDGNDKTIDFKKLEIVPEFYNESCPTCLKQMLKEKPFLRIENWSYKPLPKLEPVEE